MSKGRGAMNTALSAFARVLRPEAFHGFQVPRECLATSVQRNEQTTSCRLFKHAVRSSIKRPSICVVRCTKCRRHFPDSSVDIGGRVDRRVADGDHRIMTPVLGFDKDASAVRSSASSVVPSLASARDADARGNVGSPAALSTTPASIEAQAFGEYRRGGEVGSGKHDAELFAAQAPSRSLGRRPLLATVQTRWDGSPISTQAVVDLLEMVEIERDQGQRFAAARSAQARPRRGR